MTMDSHNLRIVLSPFDLSSGSTNTSWVKLEQIKPPAIQKFVNIADVYRLWLAAATGQSAIKTRAIGCPVEFDGSNIHVYLGFYIWPSSPDLNFSISPSNGTVGMMTRVRKLREFCLFINNTDRADLPYYMEDASVTWEMQTYNEYGDEIPAPEIVVNGRNIQFSTPVFAAIRVSGFAVGFSAVSEMVLSRPMEEEDIAIEEQIEDRKIKDGRMILATNPTKRLNGYKVTNLENTITASWVTPEGKTDTTQLRLEIPQCVKDVLAFCPDMFETILLWCSSTSTRQVYYNACNGDVIYVRDGVNPVYYCNKIVIPEVAIGRPSWLPRGVL